MDEEQALEIITLLAEGVHPFTGEALRDDHILQDPRVIRALHKAILIFRDTHKHRKKEK